MQLLREIKDKEIPEDKSEIRYRKAARAILLDSNKLTPLLYVSSMGFHKIPGGGIDEGENIKDALKREVLEETGCEIEITGEVGKIIEYRSEISLIQKSYCYTGEIISKDSPNFTQKELDQGFKLVWLTIDEAIHNMTNEKVDEYHASFMHERDLTFLQKYLVLGL